MSTSSTSSTATSTAPPPSPPSKKQCLLSKNIEDDGDIGNLRNDSIEIWKLQEDAADCMVPLIGRLYRKNNVITTLFGRGLVHRSSIEIIKIHSYVCKHIGIHMDPTETLPILSALCDIPELVTTRVDIGRTYLLVKSKFSGETKSLTSSDITHYLQKAITEQIASIITLPEKKMTQPKDVVLYGFGRIGRLLARLLIEKSGSGVKLMLRAIVVRKNTLQGDIEKRASLLRRDSVHGPFNGTIRLNHEQNALIANGNFIHILYSDSPENLDYTKYDINNAVVIDNTGIWRDEKQLSLHLQSKGISKVILTAPAKGDITTIVAGVNNDRVSDNIHIYSAASCTTNAITPCLAVLHDKFGIEDGHIETVHSFTNDQNLIDNYHMKERRGRSAVLNMVITETGAANAVVKCLPYLKGKLTANAIRVPTPNVSLAILNLTLKQQVDVKAINNYMAKMATNSPLQNQIDYVDSSEVVSSDFVGNRATGIVDGKATIVAGNKVHLYVWYDNEFGYSCQVIRLLQKMMGIEHATFPNETHSAAIDDSIDYFHQQ